MHLFIKVVSKMERFHDNSESKHRGSMCSWMNSEYDEFRTLYEIDNSLAFRSPAAHQRFKSQMCKSKGLMHYCTHTILSQPRRL